MSWIRKTWIGFWLIVAVPALIWGESGAWFAAFVMAMFGCWGLAKSLRDREISNNPDFSQAFKIERGGKFLALDSSSKRIALWAGKSIRHYEGDSILAVDVEKDGQTYSTSSHGLNVSLLGGAVGALLAGPVGLLVGGVSGASSSTQSFETVTRLDLSLKLRDPDDPIFEMKFFKSSKPMVVNSSLVKVAANELRLWAARLRAIGIAQ